MTPCTFSYLPYRAASALTSIARANFTALLPVFLVDSPWSVVSGLGASCGSALGSDDCLD
jgi:hypothetical protein